MRTSLFKNTLGFGLVAASMAFASVASAAPIANWDYTVSSVFDTTPGNYGFTAGTGTQNVGSGAITWGGVGAANRSGIGIAESPKSGILVTDGGPSDANLYTHSNNPIAGEFATLTFATIHATLGLREQGSGDAYTYFDASYTVRFSETPNATPCAADSPAGNPCNDIWVIEGSLNQSFLIGDYNYFFSFYAFPELAELPDNVCQVAGAPNGCIGFTTVEGQANEVQFALEITSREITVPGQVPEPASIALLGAGLLGLVGVRVRKQKNKA